MILIEDPLKEEAAIAVERLHRESFEKVVMLTGDSRRTARAVAEQIGIDDWRSEVLLEDKASYIAAEHAAGQKVVMVGDGINDSPALSAADVGDRHQQRCGDRQGDSRRDDRRRRPHDTGHPEKALH